MHSSNKSLTNYLWIGFLSIAIISAYFCFSATAKTTIDVPIRGDAREYVAYAHNLKVHGIFSRNLLNSDSEIPPPDAVRSPGYPFFLSFFISPSHQSIAIDKVAFFQAGLTVMTVIVYMLLFIRFMPYPLAILAGFVTAISPHLINASVYLLTETLFTFLLGAHLLVLEKAVRTKGLYWAIFAGILLGYSLLVRPTTQYLFIIYLLIIALKFRATFKDNWKIVICLLLPVLIAISSWSIRNVVTTGQASDPSLMAIFLQNGMYINLMYEDRPESYGYPYTFDPKNDEMQGNIGKVLEITYDRFTKEPRRYLAWLLIGKPIVFFDWNLTESVGDAFIYAPIYSPYFDNPLFRISHQIAQALHPFLMILGVIGAFVAVSQKNKSISAVLLSVVMFYFLLFHMIGSPFPRYSIPLRPISYGLAFYTLFYCFNWIKTRYTSVKP